MRFGPNPSKPSAEACLDRTQECKKEDKGVQYEIQTFSSSAGGGNPVRGSPIPNTLYPILYTLCPVLYTLYPIPYTLYPIPHTLYPMPYTLYPVPGAGAPSAVRCRRQRASRRFIRQGCSLSLNGLLRTIFSYFWDELVCYVKVRARKCRWKLVAQWRRATRWWCE